jgi:AbrB family looped-hinge helix DNA binding protein
MALVQIDSKYRIVIPSELRKYLKIEKGQEVYIAPYGKGFLIVPLNNHEAIEIRKKLNEFKNMEKEKIKKNFLKILIKK